MNGLKKQKLKEKFGSILKKQKDLGLKLLRQIKKDLPKSTKRTPIAWSDKLTTKYLNELVKTDSKNVKVPEDDVHRY